MDVQLVDQNWIVAEELLIPQSRGNPGEIREYDLCGRSGELAGIKVFATKREAIRLQAVLLVMVQNEHHRRSKAMAEERRRRQRGHVAMRTHPATAAVVTAPAPPSSRGAGGGRSTSSISPAVGDSSNSGVSSGSRPREHGKAMAKAGGGVFVQAAVSKSSMSSSSSSSSTSAAAAAAVAKDNRRASNARGGAAAAGDSGDTYNTGDVAVFSDSPGGAGTPSSRPSALDTLCDLGQQLVQKGGGARKNTNLADSSSGGGGSGGGGGLGRGLSMAKGERKQGTAKPSGRQSRAMHQLADFNGPGLTENGSGRGGRNRKRSSRFSDGASSIEPVRSGEAGD